VNKPAVQTSVLEVGGMSCQGCARAVTGALEAVDGVDHATVELAPGRAVVVWRPGKPAETDAVIAAVRSAGFEARVWTPPSAASAAGAPSDSAMGGWRFNVLFGGTITALLMIGEWGFHWGMERWFQLAALVLALPVQVFCGARFYRGAWRQARVLRANMDLLVALGSSTAFLYSAWALAAGGMGHLYFLEAASIITLISIGHWLEAMASDRAAGALKALMILAPATARRLDPSGAETAVPVATLTPGDRVVLKPGDRVPVDGSVEDGESSMDEAMLTGEAVPVEKRAGAKVYAGTLNQEGRLVMRVTATGADTALAQIIAVVQRAQQSRAEIQRLGDRVSSVFVPVVVGIAALTGLWWGLGYESAGETARSLMAWLWPVSIPAAPLAAAVVHAAAVLIVACPCAMGLATPVAIMAGTNAAASRGILVRDGVALEKTGRITAVVFDKTGTLTEGRLELAAAQDLRPAPERPVPLETLAAALAAPSQHPLSRVLARVGDPAGCPVAEWSESRGRGVQARWRGEVLRLGALPWLEECRVTVGEAGRQAVEACGQGATVVGLAIGDRLAGLFALRDRIKPGARKVVARLRAAGKEVYLLSGDRAVTALALAVETGIPAAHVFAEVRPEHKASRLRALQERGVRVAFVGDGINDAPALAQADLGVAVARASDVAREAADVVLLRSDLEVIPEVLALAQATLRTIRQNLFWAFFYNAAAVPLAALGFLSPIVCAAAMGLSDVLVIGNALRLRHRRFRI